jgi:hypothetical protein
MKKIGLIIFGIALVMGVVLANFFSFGRLSTHIFHYSVNLSGTKGSGNVIHESREISGFNAVDVSSVFQVEITAQKDFAVEIEADDNLMALIRTDVDGDVLKVSSEQKLSPSSPIRVHIYAPDIENLEVSGAANVVLNDIDNQAFSVDSSGASKIKIAGETAQLTVDVSGATNVDAEDLNTADAEIDASGASHVNVNVTGSLRADASGASRVVYTGKPESVEKKLSGASNISPK